MNNLIKWAGGKSWLAPILKDKINPNNRFVELFCGSCSLSLKLGLTSCLLNDINTPLITFLNKVKNSTSLNYYNNTEEEFYNIRSKFNLLKNLNTNLTNKESIELASYFYYLNKHCFNGLYRNSRGEFNVPYGKYKNPSVVKDFSEYTSLMKDWSFSNFSYEKVELQSNDVVYIDPPYDSEFSKYHKNDFNWDDQLILLEYIIKLKQKVIVSNQATVRIVDAYKQAGLDVKIVSAPRRISCKGNRDNQDEVLAFYNW